MSSYSKLIVFIAVLIIVSLAIVTIDSSMDNINKSMPEISDGIVQGDKDYNESVNLLNNKHYDDSMKKAESAGDNYNDSLKKLIDVRDKFHDDLKDIHRDYLDTTIEELQLKLDAVDELKESISYLKMYYNYTGSTHASEANDIIYDAIKYQNERNQIVKDNPKLFN